MKLTLTETHLDRAIADLTKNGRFSSCLCITSQAAAEVFGRLPDGNGYNAPYWEEEQVIYKMDHTALEIAWHFDRIWRQPASEDAKSLRAKLPVEIEYEIEPFNK